MNTPENATSKSGLRCLSINHFRKINQTTTKRIFKEQAKAGIQLQAIDDGYAKKTKSFSSRGSDDWLLAEKFKQYMTVSGITILIKQKMCSI